MTKFERIITYLTNPWIILSVIALISLSYQWIDKPLAAYFYHLNLSSQAPWLLGMTDLGKGVFYVPLFTLLALFFRYLYVNTKLETSAWFLLLCILVPNAICLVLKIIFGRARPELWFEFHNFGFYWLQFNKLHWSFPSSHTTTITGLMTGFSILLPRFVILFVFLCLIIASSRIILYQHYLSDVLSAFYLTILEIGLLVYCLKARKGFSKIV